MDAPARPRSSWFRSTDQTDPPEIPVSRFYAQKIQSAALGFFAPLMIPIFFQLALGFFFPLPLIASPVVAAVMWTIPDSSVRTRARQAEREFTRFVTVYLELVAVALLGNTTAGQRLTSAASVSDSWVFRRIRREYQLADLTRTSKWDALERLGDTIGVPALIDMSRMMRMAEARVGVRNQLRAACDKLRAQLAADDTAMAERVTSRMDIPVMLTLAPILAIVITRPLCNWSLSNRKRRTKVNKITTGLLRRYARADAGLRERFQRLLEDPEAGIEQFQTWTAIIAVGGAVLALAILGLITAWATGYIGKLPG